MTLFALSAFKSNARKVVNRQPSWQDLVALTIAFDCHELFTLLINDTQVNGIGSASTSLFKSGCTQRYRELLFSPGNTLRHLLTFLAERDPFRRFSKGEEFVQSK